MENNFEHARAFAHDYLQKIGQDLNAGSLVRVMTEWAATLGIEGAKPVINDAAEAFLAQLQAKIAELEDKLVQQDAAHKESLIALQTQSALKEFDQPDAPEIEVKTPKKRVPNG